MTKPTISRGTGTYKKKEELSMSSAIQTIHQLFICVLPALFLTLLFLNGYQNNNTLCSQQSICYNHDYCILTEVEVDI